LTHNIIDNYFVKLQLRETIVFFHRKPSPRFVRIY